MKQTTQTKKKTGIYVILVVYWLVLLVWQNVRSTENRDTIDLIIKAALVLMLIIGFFFRKRSVNVPVIAIFLVYISIYAATKTVERNFTFSSMMFYFFPLIVFLLTLGVGINFTISKKELIRLCYILIVADLYITLYAIIVQPEKYLDALSVQNAYSNELTSFLVSSHECGFYLAVGIMAAILCFELDQKPNPLKTTFLIVSIVLFSVTLILTFSRTAILAFFAMFLCYILSSGRRKLKKTLLFVAIALTLVILLVTELREYFVKIVFKDNDDAGRDNLMDAGFKILENASAYYLLFGYGQTTVKNYILASTGHASVHNAYLQTLLCNGIVGLAFLIGCLVFAICHIYKTAKLFPEHKKLIILFYSFFAALIIVMTFQTACLYSSTIDSYFLTLYCYIVPIYVSNAIRQGVFEEPALAEESIKKSKYIK